ncbi:hypothetical protein [Corynebacterium sputi]|uniref:hypothetical protein n=1 Tax=Corynebacterium sputi TaxID=489915 RepID=UPI0003F9531F|nr:hypothetical protein [Corynebacterium sputi]
MTVFDPAATLLEAMAGCGHRELKPLLEKHPNTDFRAYADRTIITGYQSCISHMPELGDKKYFLTAVGDWLRNNGHFDGPEKRGVIDRLADITHATTGAAEAQSLSRMVIEQRYRHLARDLGKRLEESWRTVPIRQLDQILREAWPTFQGISQVYDTEMKEAS